MTTERTYKTFRLEDAYPKMRVTFKTFAEISKRPEAFTITNVGATDIIIKDFTGERMAAKADELVTW